MDLDKNKIGVILGSALADLLILILAILTLNQLDSSFETSLALIGPLTGVSPSEVSPEMMAQLKDEVLSKTQFFTYLLLGFFGVFHIIHYMAFFFEKEWSKRYLKILIVSGLFLSGLYVAYQLFNLDFNKAWVMLIFPSYLYAYISFRKYSR